MFEAFTLAHGATRRCWWFRNESFRGSFLKDFAQPLALAGLRPSACSFIEVSTLSAAGADLITFYAGLENGTHSI